MGTTSNLTNAPSLSALWQQIKSQAIANLAAPLIAASNNVIATPNTQEVVLQGPQLLTSLVALGPHLESQAWVDLATLIRSWATQLSTPVSTSASTPTPAA